MSKKSLRSIFENIASGAAGAGSIAGFRGSLFGSTVQRPTPPVDTVTLSPYATTPNSPKRKKKKMKVKGTSLKENHEFDTVTTSALRDLLRQKQRDSELRDGTEVFALEDNDGAVVKVYVKKDQAEEFKKAIETILADEEEQGKEIAEILFDLHKGFDIVSVDWGQGSIPEDEENIANSTEAEEQGFPDSAELGDVDAEVQGTEDEASAIGDPALDGEMSAVDTDATVDQTKMLTQIIALLQSQADAQRAEADAAKAKADVEAAHAAAKAAAQYSSYQEEVMDMENYNKRQQEERRENQIQAKLIRYRHDLRKDASQGLEDKLNDPEYLLNTLHKASIGESVTTKYNPATPEEEEVLKMEDWEKAEKERKKEQQVRDRLIRFRHSANKSSESTVEGSGDAPADPEAKKFDPKSGRLMDYLLRLKDHKKASEHNAAQQ